MFEEIGALNLAHIQFAFTVSAHIIFPALTIGMASYLAVLNGIWLVRRDDAYMQLFQYWKTIFAVIFGMGVVSGIVMAYQFGTNWSVFSDRAGPVIAPLMGYEVLTAFFLEAGFLGVMLFGRERVGPKLHFLATLMVAVGTLGSAFWILSVNSWMQTPAGFGINEVGQFVPESWLEIIFNPSFPYRLVHMVLAAYLTTAFCVGAVGAYHLLKDQANRHARIMFSMAMWMALIVAPIQMLAGDFHGLNTLEHQPAKIAAMEGHWEPHENGAPLILFGIPDDEAEVTRYAIEIPYLSSIILTHSLEGKVPGLKEFPRDERPPSEIVFYSFRVMVGIGVLMTLVGLWSGWARYHARLYDAVYLHRFAVLMGPSGIVAVLAGWITTEVGRQPYTVYGLMRTADSISPVGADAVGWSLVAFVLVYFFLFGWGTVYALRLMMKAPKTEAPEGLKITRTSGFAPGVKKLGPEKLPAE